MGHEKAAIGKRCLWIAVLAAAIVFTCSAGGKPEAWKVVREQELAHRTNVIGFETVEYGVTVGYAGESHYTNDGGGTWPRSDKVEALCRFGMDIIDHETAVSGGNGGMVMTADGCRNWNLKNMTRFDVLSFLTGTTGWLANKKHIFSTFDGCITLTDISLPESTGNITAVSLYGENAGCYLDDKGSLRKTADGGKTWTERTIRLPVSGYEVIFSSSFMRFRNAMEGLVIVMVKKDDTAGYLGLITNDGGKTWKASTIGEGLGAVYISRDIKLVTLYNPVKRIATLYSRS